MFMLCYNCVMKWHFRVHESRWDSLFLQHASRIENWTGNTRCAECRTILARYLTSVSELRYTPHRLQQLQFDNHDDNDVSNDSDGDGNVSQVDLSWRIFIYLRPPDWTNRHSHRQLIPRGRQGSTTPIRVIASHHKLSDCQAESVSSLVSTFWSDLLLRCSRNN